MKGCIISVILIIFLIALVSANPYSFNLYETPTITNVSQESVNHSNSTEWWITDEGDLNNVDDISHNDLGGLQGGTLGEYYHLNLTVFNEIMTNIFNYLTPSVANGLYLLLDASNGPITGDLEIQANLNVTKNITVGDQYRFNGSDSYTTVDSFGVITTWG